MRDRTKAFSIAIVRFVSELPNDRINSVLSRQLLRSGTSVGANYRSASYAKSPADMIAKLKLVEEEADESAYWLELIESTAVGTTPVTRDLKAEATEIFRIASASVKTLRQAKQ